MTTTWNSNQLGRMQIGLRLQLCWADQKQTWLTSWVCMCLYIENHWGMRSLILILFICHTAQQKNCKSMKVLVATIRGRRSHWSACARGTCRQCQAHGSSMVILLVPPGSARAPASQCHCTVVVGDEFRRGVDSVPSNYSQGHGNLTRWPTP